MGEEDGRRGAKDPELVALGQDEDGGGGRHGGQQRHRGEAVGRQRDQVTAAEPGQERVEEQLQGGDERHVARGPARRREGERGAERHERAGAGGRAEQVEEGRDGGRERQACGRDDRTGDGREDQRVARDPAERVADAGEPGGPAAASGLDQGDCQQGGPESLAGDDGDGRQGSGRPQGGDQERQAEIAVIAPDRAERAQRRGPVRVAPGEAAEGEGRAVEEEAGP